MQVPRSLSYVPRSVQVCVHLLSWHVFQTCFIDPYLRRQETSNVINRRRREQITVVLAESKLCGTVIAKKHVQLKKIQQHNELNVSNQIVSVQES